MAARILVYGSLNVDYVYRVPHILIPGETLLSSSRNVFAGGKGLNQAVSLSRAGGDTYFAGAVGAGDGAILLDALKGAGINTDFVAVRSDGPSGHTFIQVDDAGQNCILLYGGANRTQSEEEIRRAVGSFSEGDIIVLQNEVNDLDLIIREAHDRGLKVCLNVSPLDSQVLECPLELCSLLIVNEIEGGALTGMESSADPMEMLSRLRRRFPGSSVLLTLGSRGSVFAASSGETVSCGSYRVEAVDTTAAGDTFLGYFVTALARRESAERALRTAAAAAALAVTREGAVPSIPHAAEVEEFMKSAEPASGLEL